MRGTAPRKAARPPGPGGPHPRGSGAAPSTPAEGRSGPLRLAASLAGAVVLAVVVLAAQIHGLDLSVYREGALALLGRAGDKELYDDALIQTDTRGLPFTYPPFAAILFVPLALLPAPAALGVVTALSCLCLVGVAVVVVRYLQAAAPAGPRHAWRTPAAVLAAMLLIGISGPWREGLGFGQVNALLMVLILADLLRSTRLPSGVLVGIAAGIKLTPLAFGLVFLARRDWRSLAWMAAAFAGTVAVGRLLAPRESAAFWLDALFDASRVGATADLYNVSLNSLVAQSGLAAAVQRPVWLLASLAVVAVGYVAIRRAGQDGDGLRAITANAVVMLAISPISWFHHWVWIALVFPVGYVYARRHTGARRWTGRVLLAALVPVMLFSSITVTLTLTGTVSGEGPLPLRLFTGLGVVLPVALLAVWASPQVRTTAGPPTRG
ncbi:glycosyltransferase 87 family protein [Arthrobacter agilis]|uniref:glycosyltransferase 87 family protein n=1 Tax=Arthrobacter agilis TaxID=37921 RepID=UPI0027846AB1|nr:glycosyltransferase 87 family protein [Arthrobacter agilis]MDQ0736024.1 alpha-1,2-mannosyltransferase [Arthrobacter agilis]